MSQCRSASADRRHLAVSLLLLLSLTGLAGRPSDGAEPPAREAATTLLLEVVRDGQPTGELLEVRQVDGRLTASAAAARAAGLDPSGTAGVIDLSALGAELDAPNQRLIIGGGTRVVAPPRAEEVPALPASWGGLLDYDIQGVWSGRPSLGGVARLRGFGPPGMAEGGLLLAYDDRRGSRVQRLDSTVLALREDGLLALRGGDVVSGALGWTRPLRLGGAQVSRDFSLRPDLVTTPLAGIGGRVAVPSTVDVLVDGTRRLSADVPGGPFELRGLPVLNGAGQVTLAVRDAAGRESRDTLSFYATAALLTPGEATWSLSAGAVRQGYGTERDQYGEAAATATLRYGLHTDLTGEAHMEAGAGTAFGGASAAYRLYNLGLLTASVAYGANYEAKTGRAAADNPFLRGAGLRWGVGFERQGRVLSFNASTLRSAGSPRDVASALGDPLPRTVDRAGLSLALGDFGSLGLGWTATQAVGEPAATQRGLREGRRVELANLSWTGRVTDSVFAYATGYSALRGGLGSGVVVGLSFSLGENVLATAQTEQRGRNGTAGVGIARAVAAEGGTGWRANLANGQGAISNAAVEHRATFGTLGAEVERSAGQTYARVTTRGALVAMGGLHAVPPVYDAFALVDADGQEGVTVLRENQPVGRTGRDGKLLVTGLSSNAPNRLALDTLDQAMEILTERPERQIRLPRRAGAVLHFPTARAGLMTVLVDANGAFLPLDAVLEDEAGRRVQIGLDGQAWWPEGVEGRILATLPGGHRCTTPRAQGGQLRCA